MKTFIQKLDLHMKRTGSCLCVGLDTDYDKLPARSNNVHKSILDFNKNVIESTSDLACCYKINSAFYEKYGADGIFMLKHTIQYIGNSIPVILDAKRGDIGNSSWYYAQYAFDHLKADSITVLPYMGMDSLAPFFKYRDKQIFVVALSSNPGGRDFQDTPFYNPLYLRVIKKVNAAFKNAGFVFGATRPEYIKKLRNSGYKNLLLIPGVGTQGGDAARSMEYAFLNGGKAVFNISRGILYAGNGKKYYNTIREKAKEYRDMFRI
ncbi:MAG: orotidine-5'-phosphate decarboxylase [Spirochaetes bacterium]|nr:orotidine-5'-phosphate decarboxylase [Spirochaetota bacterium]